MSRKPWLNVVAAVALLALLGLPGQANAAETWPDFQANGLGLQPATTPLLLDTWDSSLIYTNLADLVGGLGWQVRLKGWPRLLKRSEVYTSLGGTSFDLGTISVPGTAPTNPLPTQKDWTYAQIPVVTGLTLHVSRATPALVVDASGSSLTFFGGGGARPAYFATTRGVYRSDQLGSLNLNDLSGGWLLVWFGAQGALHSTRFPVWPKISGQERAEVPLSAVDLPVLFVFQNQPASLQLTSSGLTFGFSASAGRGALVPLYGDYYPLVAETAAWSTGLPAAVKSQAVWWSAHLGEVPTSVHESYSYDDSSDTITASARADYLSLRSGGTPFAPVPPMLALAAQNGFPVQFSGSLVQSSALTSVGPYAGIDAVKQYSYSATGLGKYARQTRTATAQTGEPAWLDSALAAEVRKVTQAGHLAPWCPASNGFLGANVNCYAPSWSNPGETLYYLADVLPLLASGQQSEVASYLRTERTAYPPETVAVESASAGARREMYRIDPLELSTVIASYDQRISDLNFYRQHTFTAAEKTIMGQTNPALVPVENVYDLFSYYRALGDGQLSDVWYQSVRKILYPFLYRQDWATLGWYQWQNYIDNTGVQSPVIGEAGQRYINTSLQGHGGIVEANAYFAALVGGLRFAYQVGDETAKPILWGQFLRTAALRYGMDQYAKYLYNNRLIVLPTDSSWLATYGADYQAAYPYSHPQDLALNPAWMVKYLEAGWEGHLYTYNWTGPGQDLRSVVELDQFGVQFDDTASRYAGRNLLPYLGLVPELGRFLADHEAVQARAYVDRVADNMPDWYFAKGRQGLGAETNYLPPETAYQLFVARAWVLGETPAALTRYLDTPWVGRGDLYYIHKLAEIIRAYRGSTWSSLM